MAKSGIKLFVYAVLLLVLLFSLIKILVPLEGYPFILEFMGLLLLVVLLVIGFAGYSRRWGELVFFFVFLLYLVNVLLMWFFLGYLYVVLLIIALVGFLLAVPQLGSGKGYHPDPGGKSVGKPVGTVGKVAESHQAEPHSEVFEPENTRAEARLAEKRPGKNVAATFIPGKFVASSQSNTYHLPRCEWAKKIHKTRQVWFKSKDEAWEKGYRAHSCIGK